MKKNQTLSEIRLRGHQALFEALGPVGFIRFMQQFVARDDYTKDREKSIHKLNLDDIESRATQAAHVRRKRAG